MLTVGAPHSEGAAMHVPPVHNRAGPVDASGISSPPADASALLPNSWLPEAPLRAQPLTTSSRAIATTANHAVSEGRNRIVVAVMQAKSVPEPAARDFRSSRVSYPTQGGRTKCALAQRLRARKAGRRRN